MALLLVHTLHKQGVLVFETPELRKDSMWQVPKPMPAPMPAPLPPTGITPVASAWSAALIRLDNATSRKYLVRCTRKADVREYNTEKQEVCVEVEAESREEAVELVEEMLREGEVEDWETYDTLYNDSDGGDVYEEEVSSVEEV